MSKNKRVILSIFLMVISTQPLGRQSSVLASGSIPIKQAGSNENIPLQGQTLDNLVALAHMFGNV